MRIVVNDIAAEYGGALTVLKSFYEYIIDHDHENEYIFLLSIRLLEETDHIKIIICDDVKKSGLHKMKFDFFTGRKLINELKPDYVLSLQNIITVGVKARQGVYVHQSIPFQNEKKFSLLKSAERGTAIIQRFIGAIIKRSVRKADDVFVQTKWMRENVAQKSRVSIDKISVVPFEAKIYQNAPVAADCPKNKFFYPATFESIYKNQDCIYKAIDTLKSRGICDYQVLFTLPADQQPMRDQITHCGMLSTEELYQAYADNIIIFPSYIETIGLPLLEAQETNTVIFAADCQYAREVLEGYANAYYFHPFHPDELADLMQQAIMGEIKLQNHAKDKHQNQQSWNVILETIND